MKISLITPAPAASRAGNRTTALRWANIFEDLGHTVAITVDYAGEDVDLMVALHAWRSAGPIRRFRARYPDRPLIVGLSGTDVYRDLDSHAETVLDILDRADALVGLHDLVADALPARFREKLTVIYQSAEPMAERPIPGGDRFEVLVVGHLRDEKDPLRAALAARLVPPASRISVVHLGRAHTPEWGAMAAAEMAVNPRYEWRGEVPGHVVRDALSRARVMVLSSVMEGGANVISEAIAAKLPILASRIDGSVGLLGRDYRGYFPTGDTRALAALMTRAEEEAGFLSDLGAACATRAPLFAPAQELSGWKRLLAQVTRPAHERAAIAIP